MRIYLTFDEMIDQSCICYLKYLNANSMEHLRKYELLTKAIRYAHHSFIHKVSIETIENLCKKLYDVHSLIWCTESSIRKAQENDLGLEEVGRRALVVRDLNRERQAIEQLIDSTPDHSLTLFDRGFYSLGLLYRWQQTGTQRHWLLPLRKDAQYEVLRKLGRHDAIVSLKTSPQARKQWPDLPDTLQARLLSKTIKGKVRQVLTSMIDPPRFPPDEIVELYSQRWEIELGYREMKQGMLAGHYTLRSKTPEMIEQELW